MSGCNYKSQTREILMFEEGDVKLGLGGFFIEGK